MAIDIPPQSGSVTQGNAIDNPTESKYKGPVLSPTLALGRTVDRVHNGSTILLDLAPIEH